MQKYLNSNITFFSRQNKNKCKNLPVNGDDLSTNG